MGEGLGFGPTLLLTEVGHDAVDDFTEARRDGDVVFGLPVGRPAESRLEKGGEDLVGGADADEVGGPATAVGMRFGYQTAVGGLDLGGRGVMGQAQDLVCLAQRHRSAAYERQRLSHLAQ